MNSIAFCFARSHSTENEWGIVVPATFFANSFYLSQCTWRWNRSPAPRMEMAKLVLLRNMWMAFGIEKSARHMNRNFSPCQRTSLIKSKSPLNEINARIVKNVVYDCLSLAGLTECVRVCCESICEYVSRRLRSIGFAEGMGNEK